MKRYYDVYSKVEGIMKLTFYTYGGQGSHHDLSQIFLLTIDTTSLEKNLIMCGMKPEIFN